MTAIVQDFRRAARALAKTPLVAGLVVLILALGMGATTALYSVVDALLLSPLPYGEPEGLVRVYETFPYPGGTGWGSVSVPNYRDWAAQAEGFLGLAAYSWTSPGLQGGEEPERLRAVEATAGLFDVLRVPARLGRTFAPGDDRPGADPVVVLSAGLWHRRFAADPGVIGRAVVLDGTAHTVIGVMPAGFDFPPGVVGTDVWVPLVPDPELAENRGSHWMAVVGRLAPGRSLESVQAEIEQVAARLEVAHPEAQEGRSAKVERLQEVVVGHLRPALLVLLGGTALVLLIACANAVNLLLVRAAGRSREVAIQSALGAGRRWLLGQFAAEALLLVAAAAAFGLVIAHFGVRFLVGLAADQLPRAAEIGLDGRVFSFALAVSLPVALGLGLVPALQAAPGRLHELLKEGGARVSLGRRGRRLRSVLVAGQVALSGILLICAGLLFKTFLALLAVDTGMRTDDVLTLHVSLPEGRYAQEETAERFYEPVRHEVEALPGVASAGWVSHLPLLRYGSNGNFGIAGRPQAERMEDQPFAEFRQVSPGYFETLGVPVLSGRSIGERDRDAASPVVVVNRALAEEYFEAGRAVGERVVLGEVEVAIVGVVGDVREAGLDREPEPVLYFPYTYDGSPTMTLVARTEVPPETVAGAVTAAVRKVAPDQPVYGVQSLSTVVARSMADRTLYLWLLGIFAGAALVLTVAGIYGVVSSAVAQREREIGIRVALGARPASLLALVVRQGAWLALAGLAVGIPAAVLAGRLLGSLLFGVRAADPATLAAVGLGLLGVAVAASYGPARRALGVDPVEVLRSE